MTRKALLAGLALVAALAIAGVATGWLPAAWRYLAAEPVTVEIQYVGIGCGSHLRWHTPREGVAAGARIRIVNTTELWHVPVQVAGANRADAPVLVTSPVLPPGGAWETTFWHSGDIFLRSADVMQQQAGLASWLTVN